jgi:hypothetical protein
VLEIGTHIALYFLSKDNLNSSLLMLHGAERADAEVRGKMCEQ